MDIGKQSVGEILAENYRAADLFHIHGLDIVDGRRRSLDEACRGDGVDPWMLATEIERLGCPYHGVHRCFDTMELDMLAAHIIEHHHTYLRARMPLILERVRRTARMRKGCAPEMVEIAWWFEKVVQALLHHLRREERDLFPYISAMVGAHREGSNLPPLPFGSVRNLIAMISIDHTSAWEGMQRIRALSGDYIPCRNAPAMLRASCMDLLEFEYELRRQHHIEENILFAKAIQLEGEVMSVQNVQ